MAIEKRGPMWWYRFTVRGKEYRRSTGLDAAHSNRKEAEKIEAQAKLEAIAGLSEPERTPHIPFTTAAEEFLRWCVTTEYRSKKNTAMRIATSFASMSKFFGDMAVGSISPAHIERFKTWRIETHGIRDITLRHDLHALSVFFRKYAIKAGWATDNPVDEVTKPSDKDAVRIHILTPDEESAYFAHAKGNIADLARLLLEQGCRPEEILALNKNRGDVDLAAEQIHIRGGKSRAARRTLDLTSTSMAILKRRMELPGRWVFTSPRYPDRHMIKLNNRHDEVCREAGISIVLYDFRHTFATRMLTELKVDPKTLADIMGHNTMTVIFKHYIHPSADTKKAAMKKYEETFRPKLKLVK